MINILDVQAESKIIHHTKNQEDLKMRKDNQQMTTLRWQICWSYMTKL